MKNKILTVFLVVILISFCFIGNNAFASSTFTFTDRFGNERTVPSFPESDIISSSNSFAVVNTGNYKNTLYVATGDGFFYDVGFICCSTECYMVYIVNGEYVVQPDICSANSRLCNAGELCYFSTGLYDGIYKNKLVVEAGGDFFQLAPLTLQPILEKVEMTQEITTTIVGLAKLLIPLLICLLGFCKAWQLLSKLLHKA